jgi:hypothetical protein
MEEKNRAENTLKSSNELLSGIRLRHVPNWKD